MRRSPHHIQDVGVVGVRSEYPKRVGNGSTLRFELVGFTVAGDDKVFRPTTASIEDDTVVVSSEQVSKPVAVRYGWKNFPVANLANMAGLPASPFRSDDWLPEGLK